MLGTDLIHASRKQIYALRKQTGVAFQGGALFSSMSVAENIQLALREHTKLDENTIQIMTRMKLDMVNMLPLSAPWATSTDRPRPTSRSPARATSGGSTSTPYELSRRA